MAVPIPVPPSAADRMQIELLRRAGAQRRSELALSLSTTVIEMARAAIERRHPEYEPREVLLSFVEINYGKDLAARVRRFLDERSRGTSGPALGARPRLPRPSEQLSGAPR